MATRWDTGNWTAKNDVSLFEALGITRGSVQFKKLNPKLASASVGAAGGAGTGTGSTGGGIVNPVGGQATGAQEQQNAQLAQQMAAAQPYNWSGDQWTALNNIVMAESGWNQLAENASSGAYGIPQSLPGSKMASAGADWQTNPKTQIAWMLQYIQQRYGNPVSAWNFHLANGWY